MGKSQLKQRGTIVNDQVDPFNIHTPAEHVGGDQQLGLVALEHVVAVDAFLLLEAAVDADGVEHALAEELGEFLSAFDLINEDDDLVDGEFVKEVAELVELLVLSGWPVTSWM